MKQPLHPESAEISLTGVLAALSDPVRLKIVAEVMAGGERGSTEFDCALLMENVEHEWYGRASLCCGEGAAAT